MAGEATAPKIARAELTDVARRVTADPAAALLDCALTPIGHVGIIDTTGGLHRVVGRVRSKRQEVTWRCVLKVLRRSDEECLDPATWCYWRREAAFYGSELPRALPGPLRAPRPFAVRDWPERAHVWMEDVPGAAGAWELAEFRRAARAGGASAGAFLANGPLPVEPWLVRGFLRSLLADGGYWATAMDARTGTAWRTSQAQAFGPDTRARVASLWADRDALLATLDRLPRVFGHGDLHPRNILLPVAGEEVVAVDWAFCGSFPLGTDLADLIGVGAWFCDIEADALEATERAAFSAYADGLQSAGWDGDLRLVRLGYAAALALRLGACMPGWAAWLLGPDRAPSSEVLFGRSAGAILAAWKALGHFCLDLGDEARALARALDLVRERPR